MGTTAEILLDINPPTRHSPWLWVVALVLLAVALLIGLGCRALARRWRDEERRRGVTGLERLREETLARILALDEAHQSGRVTDREAHQRLSDIVRGFAGTATDGDADFQTLSELSDAALVQPTLAPIAEFVRSGYRASFDPTAETSVRRAFDDARKVVTSWV